MAGKTEKFGQKMRELPAKWRFRGVGRPFPKAIAFARHDDAVPTVPAVGAAERQLHQRHVAIAGVDESGEVELSDVVASRAARINAVQAAVGTRRGQGHAGRLAQLVEGCDIAPGVAAVRMHHGYLCSSIGGSN
jgi:hypothetical protein